MNTLDIILIICLSAALIEGLVRGFTEQIIALVSIIAGTWAAFKFSQLVCSMLQPYLQISEKVLYVIVFVLMIVVVILLLRLLGNAVVWSRNSLRP